MGRRGRRGRSLNRRIPLCLAVPFLASGALADEPSAFNPAEARPDPVQYVMSQPSGTSPAWLKLFLTDDAENARWRIPPIRWGGRIGFDYGTSRSDLGRQERHAIEGAELSMQTYLGQPWLAQVAASVGLHYSQDRQSFTGDENAAGTSYSTRALAATGSGSLSVFPASRFPFTATYTRSDSRESGEAAPSEFVNQMFTLRQSYRTPLGDQIYMASLAQSTMTSASFGRDSVVALNGSMTRTRGDHAFDVLASLGRNRLSAGGGSDVGNLSAHHAWTPDATWSVDTLASLSTSDIENAGFGNTRTHFLQLNSMGLWRPDDESPLSVTGAVRVVETAVDDRRSRAETLLAGARYLFNANASVIGSATLTHTDGGWITTQTAGANYTSTPRRVGFADWSWNTGATVGNQTGGELGSDRLATVQLDHQLTRSIPIGSAMVGATFNQGVGATAETRRDRIDTIHNGGSLYGQVNPTGTSSMALSASVGDSRSRGGRDDHFQIGNLQLNGQLQAGTFQSFSANYTLQALRHSETILDVEQRHRSVVRSGSLRYLHNRIFGVRRLRWTLSATFNDLRLEARQLGDAQAPHDIYDHVYEQRFDYAIGRLEVKFGTRIAKIDERTDRQLFFRVVRQFGIN